MVSGFGLQLIAWLVTRSLSKSVYLRGGCCAEFSLGTGWLSKTLSNQYSISPLNRHHPLTVALNLNSRVILGLVIPDQKFVATPRNISRNLVQNLTRTAWESGISHGYLVAFLLHWFKRVNPETYFSKCSEFVYVVLQVDFSRLIIYFGQFNCFHLSHKLFRRSWVIETLQTLF